MHLITAKQRMGLKSSICLSFYERGTFLTKQQFKESKKMLWLIVYIRQNAQLFNALSKGMSHQLENLGFAQVAHKHVD